MRKLFLASVVLIGTNVFANVKGDSSVKLSCPKSASFLEGNEVQIIHQDVKIFDSQSSLHFGSKDSIKDKNIFYRWQSYSGVKSIKADLISEGTGSCAYGDGDRSSDVRLIIKLDKSCQAVNTGEFIGFICPKLKFEEQQSQRFESGKLK